MGLTGSTEGIFAPPDGTEPRPGSGWSVETIRSNIRATWLGLWRVSLLVWEASPSLTLSLAILNIVQGILPAAQVWLAKLLVDQVVAGVQSGVGLSDLPAILILVAAQFVIGALSTLLGSWSNISQQLLQERMANRVQMLVMRHANTLDLVFFERPKFYDLIQQVQRDVSFRPTAMVSTAFGLIRSLLTFASLLLLLLKLEWFIAAAALLTPLPAFISNARYGWQGYQMMRRQSPGRRMMNYLTDVLTTDTFTKEIKLFSLGSFFIRRFAELFDQYYDENRRLIIRRYLAGALWSMLTVLASGATFLYVAARALVGALSIGDLTLYVQAATGVANAFTGVLSGLQGMYEHQLYLNTLFELMDFKPAIVPPSQPLHFRRPIEEGIEFRHVTYAYENKDEPALVDVSFKIDPGETVAIVGHNGAGKTTLVKLLARLYDPIEGEVLIDGHNVREYDPDEMRDQFGVLFQDYVSYQLNARENIGIGQASQIESTTAVVSAAAQSGAASVIERLPDGYETMLGKWFKGGVQLSGGEWQKVALARAFMRDAQILILDEPSAALDARAESELFERLRELASGRTAVFISHRFSTVRQADRILVFENGRLVEHGTHQELMAHVGRYAELFELQAASYR